MCEDAILEEDVLDECLEEDINDDYQYYVDTFNGYDD